MLEIALGVPALHVGLGVGGAGHAEPVPVFPAYVGDQVGGVGEAVLGGLELGLPGRGMAPQGDDVFDAGGDQAVEHAGDLGPARAHAGQVGHRGEAVLPLDAGHEIDGEIAGGAACAVGHRDEAGGQVAQLLDGPLQGLGALVGLGGKNSKEKTRRPGA